MESCVLMPLSLSSKPNSNIASSLDYSLWDPFPDGQVLWQPRVCLLLPALCLHLFTRISFALLASQSAVVMFFSTNPDQTVFCFLLPSILPSCLRDMIHIACLCVWTKNWCRFMLELLILIWGPLSTVLLSALIWRRLISHFLENMCKLSNSLCLTVSA